MKKTQLRQGYNDDSIPTYLTVVTDDKGDILEIFHKNTPLLRTAWFDGASQIHQPLEVKLDEAKYVTYIEEL